MEAPALIVEGVVYEDPREKALALRKALLERTSQGDDIEDP